MYLVLSYHNSKYMINFIKSSIGKKFLMALSAIFLMIFLIQHLFINFLSVISPELFNEISHFMGTNIIIQFIMQPILIFSIIFHFLMGMILEIKNQKSRGKNKYFIKNDQNSWISKNMIFSGLAILNFLIIHLIDFWIHEIDIKYIHPILYEKNRYYVELTDKFHNIWRVIAYVIAFIFLGLHLSHGFKSSFQSIGVQRNKYRFFIEKIGILYSIFIPFGFCFIALYHFFNK